MTIKIPKNIHQIYWDFSGKNKPVPDKWKNSPISWAKKHPKWNYTLWNYDMIYNLIENDYPDYLDLFNSYKQYPIIQCDIGRLFILYKYGGMYIDMDVNCVKSLDLFIKNNFNKNVILPTSLYNKYLSNWLIISTKNNNFIKKCIETIKSYQQTKWYYKLDPSFLVFYTAGPVHIRNILEKYDNSEEILLEDFSNDLLEHTQGNSWVNWRYYIIFLSIFIILIFLIMIIIKKYKKNV